VSGTHCYSRRGHRKLTLRVVDAVYLSKVWGKDYYRCPSCNHWHLTSKKED
jgi:hypothetical protein